MFLTRIKSVRRFAFPVFGALISCLFLSAGCTTPPERQPEPTPIWVAFYLSPAWLPLQDAVADCAPPGSAPAWVEDPRKSAAALVWGTPGPAGWPAYQLGSETLAVIVHPDNPAQSISLDGLRLAFGGEIRDWDFLGQAPGPVNVYIDPPVGEIGGVLASAGIQPGSTAQVVPGPEQMRAAVSADPAALGLLPSRWVDPSVHTLEIVGLPEDALRAPFLAYTPGEPEGLVRQWLFCLQQSLNN